MKTQALAVMFCVLAVASISLADTFGKGANQFDIGFVPAIGLNRSGGYNFRIGKYEVTNYQWNKFKSSLGVQVIGSPSTAYDTEAVWTGDNIPVNNVSWYEALQFVNWLNTSTGHQAAYKFTGTQGTSNYTFTPWGVTDTGYQASNPYRHKDAFYFLPASNEWAGAAYWNGTTLQTYATVDNTEPVAGVDSNYNNAIGQPWAVGSGGQELNGTFDMMGNVWEWTESYSYSDISCRDVKGGSYTNSSTSFMLRGYYVNYPDGEYSNHGFRIASIPEPASILLLGLGAIAILKRKQKMRV